MLYENPGRPRGPLGPPGGPAGRMEWDCQLGFCTIAKMRFLNEVVSTIGKMKFFEPKNTSIEVIIHRSNKAPFFLHQQKNVKSY